ncbi:MAG TPA: hypothetical protein VK195_12420 [Burkholderiaceae bacterium]|nr:hypothetical protein [Burkholderiaceae bacterium]
MRQSIKRQAGQGMTEYIIIVALIAIAAIATYQFFGKSVRNQTAAIAQELSGGDGSGSQGKAKSAGEDAATEAEAKHNLATYHSNADKDKGK